MEQQKTHQEDQLDLKAILATKKKLCFIVIICVTMDTHKGD